MSGDLEHILLTSVGDTLSFSDFDDPTSVASQVARGRGKGKLAKATADNQLVPLDGSPLEDGEKIVMAFEEGTVKADPGYMMQFVEPRYHDLSVPDICRIPSFQSYTVPEPAVETLPEFILNAADEQGFVKFQGVYDKKSKEFDQIEPGWDSEVRNPFEKMIQLVEEMDSETKIVDYITALYGPSEWQDVEAIAEARGVDVNEVEANISEVTNQVDGSPSKPQDD